MRVLDCHNVLCWVGSATRQDRAVSLARLLAEQGAGICHVVFCLETRRPSAAVSSGPLTPEVIARAEALLHNLYGDAVHTMVLPGQPISEIRRFARNHRVDLIVLGEQGLAVEEEYGEKLVEGSPCPVLILFPPGSDGETSTPTPHENLRERRPEER